MESAKEAKKKKIVTSTHTYMLSEKKRDKMKIDVIERRGATSISIERICQSQNRFGIIQQGRLNDPNLNILLTLIRIKR